MPNSTSDIAHLICNASRRVLLLGQSYGRTDSLPDPLIPNAETDTNCESLASWWLSSKLPPETRARIAQRASEVFVVPPHLEAIGSIRWSHVATSAIDDAVRKVIAQPSQLPVHEWFDSGSPTAGVLEIYRLFGSVGRDTFEQWPPTAATLLQQRRTRALGLLGSLRAWVGPRGILVVEGWDPTRGDWLRARDLAHVLNTAQLAEQQVVICGASAAMVASLESDDDFRELLQSPTVRTTSRSLAEIFAESEELRREANAYAAMPDTEFGEFIVDVPLDSALGTGEQLCSVAVTRDSLRSYSASLRLLLQRRVSSDVEFSRATARAICHQFLSEGAMAHLEHVSRLAFRTPVNWTALHRVVLQTLRGPSPQDKVLIVRGQSGSGKSTLLALLAVELREAGIPVLLASHGFTAPNRNHIDEIAQRIEAAGSRCPCILIWDALRADQDYLELSRYFASRGRKILVIGTSYASSTSTIPPTANGAKRSAIIDVVFGVDLSETNRDRLLDHFAPFLPQEIESFRQLPLPTRTDNLFALLFRMFDGIRPRMTTGLLAETEASFGQMLKASADATRETVMKGDLALALSEAFGKQIGSPESFALSEEDFRRQEASIYRLVSAVMISSQAGLPMPVDLALRLLGADGVQIYRRVLGAATFIVEDETERATFLRARQRLEARIWCKRHSPSAEQRFATIEAIAMALESREVLDQQSHLEDGHYVDYFVKLLQAYGPQGIAEIAEKSAYGLIDRVITALRSRFGDEIHPRLLHAQANAIRESVKWDQQTSGETTPPVLEGRLSRLGRADQALSLAFAQVRVSAGSVPRASTRLFLAVLKAEQAAIAGTSLVTAAELAELDVHARFTTDRYVELYQRARDHWRASVSYSERNIPAIDIACWTSERFCELVGIESATECGALSEWGEAIDLFFEAAETPEDIVQSDNREREYYELIGDRQRVNQILERMVARGSSAAHALRARLLEREGDGANGPAKALAYLESECSQSLLVDRHLLAIYYRAWWRVQTGFATFFPEDKLVLPLSRADWHRLAELAEARLSLDDTEAISPLAAFHSAWAHLELGETAAAMQLFRKLAQSSEGAVRRARSLALLSDGIGHARKLRGEIRALTPEGRGRVWVPELREEFPFNASDFGETNRRIGAPFGPFVIALNYRGAFAQPIRD